VYSAEGGVPSVIDTCCPSGTVCSTTSPNGLQTVGRCCPPGQSAQVAFDGGVPILTCAGATAPSDHCPALDDDGSGAVTDTACGPGTVCMTTQVNGTTVGQCCPPDQSLQVSFDGLVPILACNGGGGGSCSTELCPVRTLGLVTSHICCPSGTSCKSGSLFGLEASTCCAGDVSLRLDLSAGGVVVDCCPAGASVCAQEGGSFTDQVCCGAGRECVQASLGLGLPGDSPAVLGRVCCPVGSEAVFSGGRFICREICTRPCDLVSLVGGCCNPPGPDCTTVCDHPIWGLSCCPPLVPPCNNHCLSLDDGLQCCDPGVCAITRTIPFSPFPIGTCSSA
jgi:hypothetical protein